MPDDLTTSEGVDEGSKDPEPTQNLDAQGAPGLPSGPVDPARPAPPDLSEDPGVAGPGQELSEGEG
jgi:hypothetical protein